MVTEDVDVSELAATIAALGLDIEENGRVGNQHLKITESVIKRLK